MSLRTTSQNRASTFTFTNSRSGGSGGVGTGSVTITSIVVTDSGFNNLDDSSVGTSNSYIKIIGTGFNSSSNIFVSGSQVSSANVTYVNSTEIRVTLPSLSLGNTNIFVFNPDYSGAIWAPGINVSGFPEYTQTSYTTVTPLEVSVQLLATGDAPLTYALQAGSSLPSGCSLSSSGLITGTTVDGVYQFTVIVSDAQNQSFQQQLTLTITSTDQYFNRTVLAINADADTFVKDASSNSFAITINGDTKPSAFSPYNTNWSNEFDGSGDSLSVPAGNAFAYGTGDFTIEGWFYQLTSLAYGAVLYAQTVSGTNYILITAGANSATPTNNLVFHFNISGAATFLTSTNQFQLNQWNHFAVVRQSGTAYLYINGVANGSAACTQDFSNTTYNPTIGTYSHSGIYYFTGYISNIRVVKGTAVYTSAFTPSTTPLTAIANTSLLTCQANRFIDNSTNAFAITKAGDTKVKAFGPFTETDTTTGSTYFDGTGDYLRTSGSNAAFQFSGDFTFECWFYSTSATTQMIFDTVQPGVAGGGTSRICFFVNSNRTVSFFSASQYTTSNTVNLGAWNHLALTRSGSTQKIFINGVEGYGGTHTSNYSSGYCTIGFDSAAGGTSIMNGYLSNCRVLKGTAVYTSNFTPPSSPLTAIANTSLLTLQGRRALNNHTFIDGSENSLVVTRGGNTSQGSFSPFSPAGWSNYFDGSEDYLTSPSNAAVNLSTGDFTIEAWIYRTSSTGGGAVISNSDNLSADNNYFYLGYNGSGAGYFEIRTTSGSTSTTGTINGGLNTWVHIAVSRESGTVRLFVNGVLDKTVTMTGTLTQRDVLIGGFLYPGFSEYYPGYISNARIVKGTAVYTSNFTPPTSALTAVANTSLLTCQSNRFIDNSTNNFTITKNGDAKVVNFSPFAPTAVYSPETYGASAYFDGTGDYLTLAANVLPDISGVFTYECWIYPMDGAAGLVFGTWNNNTGGWGLFLSNTTASFNGMSIFWYFGNYGASESARGVNSNAMITNAWNHIAVVRNASNVWAFYVNGIERGTTTFGSGISWSESRNFTDGNPVGIGTSGYTPRQSYISDARLVIGNAVYTANFTPPTAPLTKIGGTNLLLNFNSGGIIDSTSRNVLECVGDAKIVTSTRKYGTGSMYFDGTGDYLQAPNSTIANFGSEDFTIEFWMYASSQALAPIVHQTSYASNLGWIIWNYDGVSTVASTRKLSFMLNGGAFVLTTPSDAYTNNTWTHIAVVKNGTGSNNIKIYSNGSQIAAGTYSTALNNATQPLMVGGIINGVSWNSTNYYNGYLDDLRITRFARYTANFTPPTDTFLTQ